MVPYLISYGLLILLIISVWINKSKLLAYYLTSIFICDFSGWLRQQITHYPKPYTGIGFVLFAITTILYLAMPMLTGLLSIYSFTKKISLLPILIWSSVSLFLLLSYPTISGQSMLNAFYAYGVTAGLTNLVYLLSKVKQKFTFTQGTLLVSVLGSLVCYLIAIKEITVFQIDKWSLIVYCNYIFYSGVIVSAWLNRFAKKLLP